MGMFDYVNFEMDCPECGNKVDNFQSKDYACNMWNIEPTVINNFYSYCLACGAWIAFTREGEQPVPRSQPYTKEEVEIMGFEMVVGER